MSELDLEKEIQTYNWKKLMNIRGGAHDAIIGSWINWWINVDVKKHMVLNPPHKVGGKLADILFLRGDKEYLYHPVGVAEVENNPEKWMEKIETLKAYWKRYSNLKCITFLLLCITTNPRYEEKFKELLEHIKELSEIVKATWILYRLDIGRRQNDIHLIVREDEMVWSYDYVTKGKAYVIRKGQIL